MIKWELDLWNELWERSENRRSEEARGERPDAAPILHGRCDAPQRPHPPVPPSRVDPDGGDAHGPTSR
ncbi:hypothetical protein GBA65_16320 [Rubrobacter marinus]|uniref:Uncharacterized protein n=1 Tax=Rubrobacter marinus TaxID=2653852 RepID=A0A6G8Q052_9ACTN|nr:hypothetical protein [Rubrobacter marinus]QIN79836.1 hypothetical protein GBA65_16320 [Rubrobacter marinus]